MNFPQNVVLAGGFHAPSSQTKTSIKSGKIIAPECTEGFKAFITSYSQQNMLLCREGGNEVGIMTSKHTSYLSRLGWVCEGIETWVIQPDLLMCDRRWEGANQTERNNRFTEYYAFMSIFAPRLINVTCPNLPTTHDELVKIIKEDTFRVVRKDRSLPIQQEIAGKVYRDFQLFDSEHIRRICESAPSYDTCVVVCGAVHAISLHAQTGWPLHLFIRPDMELEDYRLTLLAYAYHTKGAKMVGQIR